jgi:hypothetical protein
MLLTCDCPAFTTEFTEEHRDSRKGANSVLSVFSVVTSSFGFLVGDSLNAIFEAKHMKIDQ